MSCERVSEVREWRSTRIKAGRINPTNVALWHLRERVVGLGWDANPEGAKEFWRLRLGLTWTIPALLRYGSGSGGSGAQAISATGGTWTRAAPRRTSRAERPEAAVMSRCGR